MAELQSSQERLNLALQSQKMGVWDWYVQADRLIWDQAIFDIFGVKKNETQGHFGDLEKLTHPEDIEPLLKAIHQVFEQNTTFDHQFRIIRKGEIRHIAAIGYVARDDHGDPIRMTGLNWDVTDKVIASKKLDQERAKAVANSKMASLGEMASGVAHEINNPLTIILNRANQLKSRLCSQDFEKEWAIGELVKIENTVERIAKIIRGLRAFSRNADNDPMIHCEVNSIIDETLELCLEKFKRYGVDFRVQGSDRVFTLNCRPSQISQVLLNLFNNSFDAIVNTNDPWIELNVSARKGVIRLRVTDSGHGIPSQIADRMMDPFFSTKEVGRGTGLGLSISKGIIEEHGGRLWFDREFANTSFVVEIPLDEN
jgi:C4-dicarboxylate-specific signal transduction histidine kinase